MTGAELKKWIEDNKAEDLEIWAVDDGCALYPVENVRIVIGETWNEKELKHVEVSYD